MSEKKPTFEVPEDLAKEGFKGRVFATRLIEQIDSIKTTAQYNKVLPFITNWNPSDVEIEVPGVGISLATIPKILRKALGNEINVLFIRGN